VMEEHERAVQVQVQAAVEAATAVAVEAEKEAKAHLAATTHLDVMELLSGEDLARAVNLAGFIREALDDPAVPATVIMARVEAAVRQGDKAVLACYSRYGAGRRLPVAVLAAAAAPEHAADRRRQEELRQAAVGLRLKAANAAGVVAHGSYQAATMAGLLASGRYEGRY
jgi:hypothetical protein